MPPRPSRWMMRYRPTTVPLGSSCSATPPLARSGLNHQSYHFGNLGRMARTKRAPAGASAAKAKTHDRMTFLLEGAPDDDAFTALCAHLDTLEGDALAQAIDVAERALASWP